MRVAIATLGCKVNHYDSAVIEDRLRGEGYTVVPFPDKADAYIVNTCAVTSRADAESRQLARRARRLNPRARIIMTGCYAQVRPQEAAGLPEVDFVVGLGRLADLLRVVKGEVGEEKVLVRNLRKEERVDTLGAVTFSHQTRAFLKIQEGCDLFCAFCIVPFSRGKSRSVPPRTVLEQLDLLGQKGFQEVVLTGVHLGGYGADLDPPVDLTWLLEAIEERKPVPRVRLSSLDPHEVSEDLVRLLAQAQTLCPHLHVPLQSGDDTILQRMRRRYSRAQAREVLLMVRELLPEAALGTDVIVGFPGEGEKEFAQSYAFLSESPLSYFHVFPYSPRSGTTATKFPDPVPPEVVEERALRVRKLGEEKKAAFYRRFVGQTLPVLFEHTRDKASSFLKGYSRNYLRVLADAEDGWMNREAAVEIRQTQGGRAWGVLKAYGNNA